VRFGGPAARSDLTTMSLEKPLTQRASTPDSIHSPSRLRSRHKGRAGEPNVRQLLAEKDPRTYKKSWNLPLDNPATSVISKTWSLHIGEDADAAE